MRRKKHKIQNRTNFCATLYKICTNCQTEFIPEEKRQNVQERQEEIGERERARRTDRWTRGNPSDLWSLLFVPKGPENRPTTSRK